MLHGLLKNKNVERILLFLFVNECCYGTQIKTLLRVPLTPVQQALRSLEQAGIVHSYFEGKNKMFSFHPSYPLHDELHILLKKAYTLLLRKKSSTVLSTNRNWAFMKNGSEKREEKANYSHFGKGSFESKNFPLPPNHIMDSHL
jgi:DNA-binding transcriptional ArsR family regulator